MKNKLILMICFFLAGIIIAPGVYALDGIFFGLNPEANAHTRDTREGVSLGSGFILGFDLNSRFSTGIKASYFNNLDTLGLAEGQAFFRYYPWQRPGNTGGLFVQAEAGSVIYFENKEIFPWVSGGLSVGWRFNIGKNWFLEPVARAGYPYIWGGGITAGLKFQKADKKQTVIINNQDSE